MQESPEQALEMPQPQSSKAPSPALPPVPAQASVLEPRMLQSRASPSGIPVPAPAGSL